MRINADLYPVWRRPPPVRAGARPVSIHSPTRPTWSCVGCGAPWPCPSGRAQLLAGYCAADLSLSLYLATCLVEAAPVLVTGWGQPVGMAIRVNRDLSVDSTER